MRVIPWWGRRLRCLRVRLSDERAHNRYLAEANEKLARQNSTLRLEMETLRLRYRDLEDANDQPTVE